MKKIRYGVIGLGNQGKKHIESLQYRIPDAEVVACCSIVQEEVDYAVKTYGIPSGYTDYMEMLGRDDLDAVIIASSAAAHYEQITAALKAGLSVWSEKPLATTLEQCREIKKLADERPDQLFQLGFMRRFDAAHQEARKMIDNGVIGEPLIVKCNNLDPISSRDFLVKYSKTNGGIFIGMCVHDFDISRYFLKADAKKIYATGEAFVIKELKETNDSDNVCIHVQYEDGKMGLFHVSRTNPCYHTEVQIFGTEGSLTITAVPERNQVMITDQHGARKECTADYKERFKEAFFNEIKAFNDCMVKHEKPIVGIEDGIKAFEMSLAAKKSFERGNAELI